MDLCMFRFHRQKCLFKQVLKATQFYSKASTLMLLLKIDFPLVLKYKCRMALGLDTGCQSNFFMVQDYLLANAKGVTSSEAS